MYKCLHDFFNDWFWFITLRCTDVYMNFFMIDFDLLLWDVQMLTWIFLMIDFDLLLWDVKMFTWIFLWLILIYCSEMYKYLHEFFYDSFWFITLRCAIFTWIFFNDWFWFIALRCTNVYMNFFNDWFWFITLRCTNVYINFLLNCFRYQFTWDFWLNLDNWSFYRWNYTNA